MLHRAIPALLAVAGLTLPCLAGYAQNGPIPLTPAPSPFQMTPVPPSEPADSTDKIQVQELASLNPNEVGLLDDQHGGLGLTMWAGSSLGLISKALVLLPNQPGWRSLRALQLRLLESSATLPPGKTAGEPLITVRAGKLASMGATSQTAALLRILPNPAMSPILRRLQVDSALLSGDNATACSQESALRGTPANDNFVAELQVFCQFLAGKTSDGSLGVDVLRDQKLRDPTFFIAADALGGLPPAKMDGFADASPLTLAMASLAKLPLPESMIAASPAAHLPAIAQSAGASLETRLMAAERAVNAGVAGPELLRQIDEAITLTPTDLAAAASESGKTAKGRALLYRAAKEQTIPALRADLIQRGLAADPIGGPLLYGQMLAALPPGPDLMSFAPWAVRALLAGGQIEAARPWFAIVPSGSASAALKPLARLAGLGEPLTPLDLTTWKQARNETPTEATKHNLLLLCLLSALGDTPPDDEWLALLDGPAVITGKLSRSALAVGLMNAATAQHRGETVLYTLLSLGDQRDVEPAEFARLIGALRAVGLTEEARAFALELALAYGI